MWPALWPPDSCISARPRAHFFPLTSLAHCTHCLNIFVKTVLSNNGFVKHKELLLLVFESLNLWSVDEVMLFQDSVLNAANSALIPCPDRCLCRMSLHLCVTSSSAVTLCFSFVIMLIWFADYNVHRCNSFCFNKMYRRFRCTSACYVLELSLMGFPFCVSRLHEGLVVHHLLPEQWEPLRHHQWCPGSEQTLREQLRGDEVPSSSWARHTAVPLLSLAPPLQPAASPPRISMTWVCLWGLGEESNLR